MVPLVGLGGGGVGGKTDYDGDVHWKVRIHLLK